MASTCWCAFAGVEAEGAAPPAHASSSKAAAPGPAPGAAAAAAEALPADALLASVFHKQLRNVGALEEACCLVVDTGAPGWPVMYADETWKLWAGALCTRVALSVRHVLVGQSLSPASP